MPYTSTVPWTVEKKDGPVTFPAFYSGTSPKGVEIFRALSKEAIREGNPPEGESREQRGVHQ